MVMHYYIKEYLVMLEIKEEDVIEILDKYFSERVAQTQIELKYEIESLKLMIRKHGENDRTELLKKFLKKLENKFLYKS